TTSKVRLSGSFLPIVVAIVLLGGPPAAVIGIVTIVVGTLVNQRTAFHLFLALAINFTLIAGYGCYLERSSFWQKVRTALVPLLPSELAAALMAVGVAYLYVN